MPRAATASDEARPPPKLGLGTRLTIAFAAAAALPPTIIVGWLALRGDQTLGQAVLPTTIIALVAALVAFVAGRSITHTLDQDLWQLLRAARRLATGDTSHVIEVRDAGELSDLAREFERVGVRLEALGSALDNLEVKSGFELGRRMAELESFRGETRRLRSEATVICAFATSINRTVDSAQICSQFVSHADGSVPFVWAIAYLVDRETKRLAPAFIWDRQTNTRLVGKQLKQLSAGADLGERPEAVSAVQRGQIVRIDDREGDRWRSALPNGLRSMLVVPLLAKGESVGAVQFADPRPDAYGEREEQFLTTLAGQAATAVTNARLLEDAAKVEALRELDRLKSELLSTVSHELRTPLVSIKGYADTLLRTDVEWTEDERREFLRYIDEESDRLCSLIEDLLQMSQIEAGKLLLRRQAVHLGRVAQKVVRKARLDARNHRITLSFPSDLPFADGDAKKIEQVLTNLVQNAVKYSPSGGSIRVRGLAGSNRGDGSVSVGTVGLARADYVVVAVADEGAGIAPEHHKRIFDRFYRIDGKLSRETGGSGLGLAICRGIVEAHGGRIWVESPGRTVRSGDGSRGSTFYFSLPKGDPTKDDLEDLAGLGPGIADDEDRAAERTEQQNGGIGIATDLARSPGAGA